MPSSRARSFGAIDAGWPHHRDRPRARSSSISAGHLVPAAVLRQPVELGVQVAPPVALERGRVRRRRSVERELLAGDVLEPLELLLAVGGDDERGAHDLHVGTRAARRGEAPRPARAA